ncbi:hypothetical protein A1O7_07969 [Cladophialophora yegresii CBS 114405]|uniref:Uncharacterized protein n=1 Tax=Cladophialophora yegresii CBS 114405 TaxID=1182544 RepID=W9VY28_9EURO|nr:uncharacterized protein A1O7_07969 [Cladophialophora yegresii CBS 114405]EXJ57620.1 hypothetical protein A1O7_07969 [Cladophialophora yegresii CBS 114405]
MDDGMIEETKEEMTSTPMFHSQAHEQHAREAAPQPFVDDHGPPQVEERTCSPPEDHHHVATLQEGPHLEGGLDPLLAIGLAVRLILRDFETSHLSLADARRSANDDSLLTGAGTHVTDRLWENRQEQGKATDQALELRREGDRKMTPGAESATGSYRDRSPLPPAPADLLRDRDVSMPREDVNMNGTNEPRRPPSGPSGFRNGSYDRPPPSGPSRNFSQPIQSPPTGPAASMSMSAHNRGGGASTLRAPSGPRGSVGRFDGPPPRDFPGPRGRGGLPYRGPAPHGPRGGGYGRGDFGGSSGRGDYGGNTYRGGGFGRGGSPVGGGEPSFPYRTNNSSSTTYPRTQRFNTIQQHLATNEKIVPGGKLLPSGLPPDQEKRIKMLEAESERMRAEISEKQKLKREVLNEWEVREREREREALRSELAEQHLQQLMESEDGIGRAAF